MSKRWQTNNRDRKSKKYIETHACLSKDVKGIPYTPPDRFKPADYDQPKQQAQPWHTYNRDHGESAAA